MRLNKRPLNTLDVSEKEERSFLFCHKPGGQTAQAKAHASGRTGRIPPGASRKAPAFAVKWRAKKTGHHNCKTMR